MMTKTNLFISFFLIFALAFINISIGDLDKKTLDPDVLSTESIVTVNFATAQAQDSDVKEDEEDEGGSWASVSCGDPDEPDYCIGDGSYACCK